MEHYTYLWLREDGTPYYAGKGRGNRAFVSHRRVKRPSEESRIIIEEWPDETTAFAAEKLLIACYGRKDNGTGCLVNLTDGGEGHTGIIVGREVREKRRLARLGYKLSEETKRKIGDASRRYHSGRVLSPETRRKIGLANKGNKYALGRIQPPEERQMRSLAQMGRIASPATRQRISAAKKGCTISAEHRQKIRLSQIGIPRSWYTARRIAQ